MSALPFFSVVIPTFNRADFIEGTLASVFAQKYERYEIIVVDNCSTDNTEQILEPHIQARRIRFFKNDRNRERAYSRNVGFANATGDYVTLLDSDDLMYADNLSDAAEFAKANPQLKCFHNLYELVDENGNLLYRFKPPPLKDRLLCISNGNFMACIGNFIHRDIYTAYQFDVSEDLTGGEDWEFWLRVIGDHEIGRIEKVNSGIVQHLGRSVNSQNIDSMQRGLEYMIEKFRKSEHLIQIYANYLRRIEANSLLYLNILANDGHYTKRSRSFLRQAAAVDPGVILTSRFLRGLRRTVVNSIAGIWI